MTEPCLNCKAEMKRRLEGWIAALDRHDGPQALISQAFDLWHARHGKKPAWKPPDYVALNGAVASTSSPEEFLAAWRAFLADTSDFFKGHSPRKFNSHLDRFRTSTGSRAQVGARPAPADADAEKAREGEWIKRFHEALLFVNERSSSSLMTTRSQQQAALRHLLAQGITPDQPWGPKK